MDNFRKLNCGTVIKQIRLKHQLTQAQFAEIIGKSISTVHAYETDTTIPPFDVISTISRVFNVPILTIMGLDDLRSARLSLAEARARLNLGTEEETEELRSIYDLMTKKDGCE